MNKKITGRNTRKIRSDNTPSSFRFSHIVMEDKQEIWVYIASGFPASLAVPILMKRHYSEYTSCLFIRETFLKLGYKL